MNPVDHVRRSRHILDHSLDGLCRFFYFRRLPPQPKQTGIPVRHYCPQRLFEFMGNRGCELPHCRYAVGVCQFVLNLSILPLAAGNL
jgi:hypothetical protein